MKVRDVHEELGKPEIFQWVPKTQGTHVVSFSVREK
jgi:hypothetical protein